MDDEILGLVALVALLIFGVFLFNLRREGFDTNTTDTRNLVRIRSEPLPEGKKAIVVRPGTKVKTIREMGPSDEPGAWTGGSLDYKNNYSRQADKRREQAKRLTNTDLLESEAVQEIGKQREKGKYLTSNKVNQGQYAQFAKSELSGLDYDKELAKYQTLYENTDLPAIRQSSSRRINFEKEQAKKPEPQGVEEVQEYFAQV